MNCTASKFKYLLFNNHRKHKFANSYQISVDTEKNKHLLYLQLNVKLIRYNGDLPLSAIQTKTILGLGRGGRVAVVFLREQILKNVKILNVDIACLGGAERFV